MNKKIIAGYILIAIFAIWISGNIYSLFANHPQANPVDFIGGAIFLFSPFLLGGGYLVHLGKHSEKNTGEVSSMEKLERLNELKKEGAISEEEFESKKQDLLKEM